MVSLYLNRDSQELKAESPSKKPATVTSTTIKSEPSDEIQILTDPTLPDIDYRSIVVPAYIQTAKQNIEAYTPTKPEFKKEESKEFKIETSYEQKKVMKLTLNSPAATSQNPVQYNWIPNPGIPPMIENPIVERPEHPEVTFKPIDPTMNSNTIDQLSSKLQNLKSIKYDYENVPKYLIDFDDYIIILLTY